jgi:hypothetical protein
MERLLQSLAKLHFRLFGTRRLSALEAKVIDAWRDTLASPEQSILDSQMKAVAMIQRQAQGARLVFYYPETPVQPIPLFANVQPDVHVADVFLGEPGTSENRVMRMKIYLNRGRLVSVEYPKRPDRYLEQHKMQHDRLKVLRVQPTAQTH